MKQQPAVPLLYVQHGCTVIAQATQRMYCRVLSPCTVYNGWQVCGRAIGCGEVPSCSGSADTFRRPEQRHLADIRHHYDTARHAAGAWRAAAAPRAATWRVHSGVPRRLRLVHRDWAHHFRMHILREQALVIQHRQNFPGD